MGNSGDDFTLAVPNLAAAAMTANHELSMTDAVNQASKILRGKTLTEKQIEDSITDDKIMCFEDNTWHIMLKRYIKRRFNLTPKQYREKWGLPINYPFVAANYSKVRSKIAKKTGLGKR